MLRGRDGRLPFHSPSHKQTGNITGSLKLRAPVKEAGMGLVASAGEGGEAAPAGRRRASQAPSSPGSTFTRDSRSRGTVCLDWGLGIPLRATLLEQGSAREPPQVPSKPCPADAGL